MYEVTEKTLLFPDLQSEVKLCEALVRIKEVTREATTRGAARKAIIEFANNLHVIEENRDLRQQLMTITTKYKAQQEILEILKQSRVATQQLITNG